MAIHANSTRTPVRPLLGAAARPGRLPSAESFRTSAPAKVATVANVAAIPERLSEGATRAFEPKFVTVTDIALAPAPRPIDLLAILDAGPIDPEALAFMSRQRRKRALAGIDALIGLLDILDPDPDLEPTMGFVMPGEVDEAEPDADEEPSLGAPDHMMGLGYMWTGVDRICDQTCWARGGSQDVEEINEDGGDILDEPHDEEDGEPSLGSLDRRTDQRGWAGDGGFDAVSDRELDRSNYEPSLGSAEHMMDVGLVWRGVDRACDQTLWARSGTRDLEEVNEDGCEQQGSDNGLADLDGVADQWGRYSFGELVA